MSLKGEAIAIGRPHRRGILAAAELIGWCALLCHLPDVRAIGTHHEHPNEATVVRRRRGRDPTREADELAARRPERGEVGATGASARSRQVRLVRAVGTDLP